MYIFEQIVLISDQTFGYACMMPWRRILNPKLCRTNRSLLFSATCKNPTRRQKPTWSNIPKPVRPRLDRKVTPAHSSFIENDNFRGEYSLLYHDVEADIRWASIALQKEPDAINIWIGNKHSTTALHRDNYENIYCQIVGSKTFVLLAPLETVCINEKFLPCATYAADMSLTPDDPPAQVPHAVWDPDRPEENPTRFSSLSRPSRIRLDPGDMLYLPACW